MRSTSSTRKWRVDHLIAEVSDWDETWCDVERLFLGGDANALRGWAWKKMKLIWWSVMRWRLCSLNLKWIVVGVWKWFYLQGSVDQLTELTFWRIEERWMVTGIRIRSMKMFRVMLWFRGLDWIDDHRSSSWPTIPRRVCRWTIFKEEEINFVFQFTVLLFWFDVQFEPHSSSCTPQ